MEKHKNFPTYSYFDMTTLLPPLAGAALTGGSILMEKMVDSDPKPQLSGHDNVYAVD